MVKFQTLHEGKNRFFILAQPQRCALHPLDSDMFVIPPPNSGLAWCPRYLDDSNALHRDQCYLCEYAELTNDRHMRASIRYAWPVWDILSQEYTEMSWLLGGMVLTEDIGSYLGMKRASTITIMQEGRGMMTRRRIAIDVGPYDYPNTDQPIPDLDMRVLSEVEMKRLFADPYSLDYPAELDSPEFWAPTMRGTNDEALWAASRGL